MLCARSNVLSWRLLSGRDNMRWQRQMQLSVIIYDSIYFDQQINVYRHDHDYYDHDHDNMFNYS